MRVLMVEPSVYEGDILIKKQTRSTQLVSPAALFPIGTILFTIAGWRSAALPRVATALFALSGILIAVPVPLHSVRLAGGVIGLGAGIWIVAAVGTQLDSTLAP